MSKFDLSEIDNSWTLFLDRDGVINFENPGTYVRNWSEFIFYPWAIENIAFFNSRFQKIFLATNQRGITRELMTLADLADIHHQMLKAIEEGKGRIDRIYYCTDAEPSSPCRKPNPGMAIQAASEFPEIHLQKSVMVGNNKSDMLFGRNAGMKTIYLKTTAPEIELPDEMIDLCYENLNAFALALEKS